MQGEPGSEPMLLPFTSACSLSRGSGALRRRYTQWQPYTCRRTTLPDLGQRLVRPEDQVQHLVGRGAQTPMCTPDCLCCPLNWGPSQEDDRQRRGPRLPLLKEVPSVRSLNLTANQGHAGHRPNLLTSRQLTHCRREDPDESSVWLIDSI